MKARCIDGPMMGSKLDLEKINHGREVSFVVPFDAELSFDVDSGDFAIKYQTYRQRVWYDRVTHNPVRVDLVHVREGL